MKRTVRTAFGKGGFTMLEAVAVLVILGIVSAVAAVRMFGTSAYDLASQVEAVKGHLRYAQTRAMNSNQVWGIDFPGDSTYSLFNGGSTASRVIIPGQDSNIVTIPSGVSVAARTVSFDAWGKPYTDAAGTTAVSGNSGDITVSKGGLSDVIIQITPNTGFIP